MFEIRSYYFEVCQTIKFIKSYSELSTKTFNEDFNIIGGL